MNEWNIQSRGHACQACNASFSDKQVYYTILFDEKRDFLRTDVCEKCWNEQYSQARDRKGFISCWHAEYHAPPAAPVDPIQKATAETLLRRIVELNDPQYAAASFILAVMLERKRLLKVKEQHVVEGRRIFIYEQPKTGDVFTIPDPQLQLNQLDAVQRDVANLLEHGLPESPQAPEPVAASEPVSDASEIPAIEGSPAASQPETEPAEAAPQPAEPPGR